MKKHRQIFPGNIDKSWTLFLDRDGVINKRIIDDYVLSWKQFEFLPGALEALKEMSSIFGRIIVVTNQQGIGKGLMTENNLQNIHASMCGEIEKQGGKIDAVYHSPYLKESGHHTRKPNVGMGLKAKKDFPQIDFKKSIMAGDSESDMEFGYRLGMINVLINNEDNDISRLYEIASLSFNDLKSFSDHIKKLSLRNNKPEGNSVK